MPIPLILGVGAAVAGIAGVGSGIHGAVKMNEANETMKSAERRHQKNLERFEIQNEETCRRMDRLGEKELKILNSFEEFSNVFEKIKNRPHFASYNKNGVEIPAYEGEDFKKVSIGAGVLLGGLGGSLAGTAGGFAAAGATTSAVMALGTASTGTAIASLSGVAATNATLAALGGGAIAAGGGGMALGTAVLGAATLGVGLLVGGAIFSATGSSLSEKADEAWSQMRKAEKQIDTAIDYMEDLASVAGDYLVSLKLIDKVYRKHLKKLSFLVEDENKTDWSDFTDDEKLLIENTVLLVGFLYRMCKVQLVLVSEDEDTNRINNFEIEDVIDDAEQLLLDLKA